MEIVDYEWKPSWEEVRINAAISALSSLVLKEYTRNVNPREAAKCAVIYAEELVEELKKKGGKE